MDMYLRINSGRAPSVIGHQVPIVTHRTSVLVGIRCVPVCGRSCLVSFRWGEYSREPRPVRVRMKCPEDGPKETQQLWLSRARRL